MMNRGYIPEPETREQSVFDYFRQRMGGKIRPIYELDFAALQFKWKGQRFYIVVKSRAGIRGIQLADRVDEDLERMMRGSRPIRSKIIESDVMELRLDGILPKDFFIKWDESKEEPLQ
jgi:hypothetical protein